MRATECVHVAARGISRNFGGAQALRGVTVSIAKGEVHGLVGENGAGKSTLGKIIAGALEPSSGDLLVFGNSQRFGSPRDALAHGIVMVDQELALVPARSVLDNVFLGHESGLRGVWRPALQRERYIELVERWGFDLDPDVPVRALSTGDQQKVEILRALASEAELIIMDEPTARLTRMEARQLHAVVRTLREQGTTIVLVSHFLEEVLELADVVTVMRDGRIVKSSPADEETPSSLVKAMLGRTFNVAFPKRTPLAEGAAVVLEVSGLSGNRFRDVSFSLRAGEILGVAGMVGSGRTELARGIFGADQIDAGRIMLDGEPVILNRPRKAIDRGVVMLPENRKEQGLVMARSVSENLVLPYLNRVSGPVGVLRPSLERERARRSIAQLGVRCDGSQAAVNTLSGGNQQKVVFGKWVLDPPRVLILDEPTRGVDVGAKRTIYELICSLASAGSAVLLISSELEEVLGLAHTILVMRRGRVCAEFTADEANEEVLLAAAFGTDGETCAA